MESAEIIIKEGLGQESLEVVKERDGSIKIIYKGKPRKNAIWERMTPAEIALELVARAKTVREWVSKVEEEIEK